MSLLFNYSFDYLVLNGREVKLRSTASEKPQTPFEEETLHFISSWINGEKFFHQKTSGSTGTPKIISLSREQLVMSAQRTMSRLPVRSGQTALVCLDTRYIAGKMMLVRALTHNLRIVATEPSGNPLQQVNEPVDFMAVVPLQMSRMMIDSMHALLNISAILIGGAPVSPVLADVLRNLPNNIYATYGMTETASNIALQRLSGPEPETAFHPLPGVEISLNDDACLIIKIPELATPVITRDVAEIFPDGSFRILGRIDHVINSGGIKILPEQCEKVIAAVLSRLGISYDFFVGSLPHHELGQQAVLIMEGRPLPLDTEQLIRNALKKELALRAPRSIFYLPEFKRTPTGKIMRSETLAQLRAG